MYRIQNSTNLSWKVKISWSKNAWLPLLAWALLVRWKVTFKNMPKIGDIITFLEILKTIWRSYKFENNILFLDTTNIDIKWLNTEMIKKIRASILLLSPILEYFSEIKIPFPWGCNIWKRPIDWHLLGFKKIWYETSFNNDEIIIKWKKISWNITINAWFWVTSTENIIISNIKREWTTTIKMAAIEPHVINLIDFLRIAWADIEIKFNHTIVINWVNKLRSNFEFEVISDYIESGTFMIIWALWSKEYIDIENARIDDLYSFIEKLNEAWVKTINMWNDVLRVYKAKKIKKVELQTNIFPWFPTDLQPPFSVLMTQAEWVSKIHEVLFEWRLNFLVELDKMRWHTAILNPHEALIFWPTKLKWANVTSWDLRAWARMVIAGLIAEWETQITNIEYIERWYENFIEKLKSLWAKIEKI